jgi:DNA-binding HxlR family transcriptional regulator
VAGFRYAQFCPLARAAEIVGERWTVLVVRELLCGPQRFSDLRRRLPGVSTSLLADRLARLEQRGLAARRELPPPAPAVVYELTEAGRALEPVMLELARFGARFLEPPRPGDHFEPDWIRLGLAAFARRSGTPPRAFHLCVVDGGRELDVFASGGPDGTRVSDTPQRADVRVRAAPLVILGLATGALDPEHARRAGLVAVEGDASALRDLPALFEIASAAPPARAAGASPSPPNPTGD